MNASFKDDCVFPIINLRKPTNEQLLRMAEPYHWAGRVLTQYPFPVSDGAVINLLALSCNELVESESMVGLCDVIGDLSIRAIVFQDPDTGNVYRRFLARDRFYGDERGYTGTITDNKGNLTVQVDAATGTVQFRANPIVIGVYFDGYRFDPNRRSK